MFLGEGGGGGEEGRLMNSPNNLKYSRRIVMSNHSNSSTQNMKNGYFQGRTDHLATLANARRADELIPMLFLSPVVVKMGP